MRILTMLPVAAAVLFSTPAFARDERPVACIYVKSMGAKRPDMLALAQSGYRPTSGAEKTAMMIVGDAVRDCRTRYGWSATKQGIALRFLSAHVLHDDAVFQGKKYGLTEDMLAGMVAKLDANGRAAWLAGQPTAELSTAAFAYFKGAGLKTDSLSAEDSAALNHAIAEGLTGLVAQQEAEKAYAG